MRPDSDQRGMTASGMDCYQSAVETGITNERIEDKLSLSELHSV
ncbi:hypothetical protein ACQXYG_12020 [Corynebacterium diphtheriae]